MPQNYSGIWMSMRQQKNPRRSLSSTAGHQSGPEKQLKTKIMITKKQQDKFQEALLPFIKEATSQHCGFLVVNIADTEGLTVALGLGPVCAPALKETVCVLAKELGKAAKAAHGTDAGEEVFAE